MLPTNKNRNIRSSSGNVFPGGGSGRFAGSAAFAFVIASALKRDFGGTHAAVKMVVSLTQANERAVKNWFSAKNGPSGQHLVDLIRSSDEVLEALLEMAGRREILMAKKLADGRMVLQEILALMERWQAGEDS